MMKTKRLLIGILSLLVAVCACCGLAACQDETPAPVPPAEKQEGAGTVSLADWTYGETAATPALSGVPAEYGAPAYTYVGRGDTVYAESATVPANAGTYTVKASFAATTNYKAYETSADFAIVKADGTGTVSLADWVFGEAAAAPALSGVPEEYGAPAYTYVGRGDTVYAESATAPENRGTYTVKASFAATANYNAYTVSADFAITKKLGAGTVSITGWTYGAAASAPTVAGVPAEYGAPAYTYVGRGDTVYAESATVPANAGTYTVKASFAGTANYEPYEATADFAIAKASVSGELTMAGWTYGGTASEPAVSGVPSEGYSAPVYAYAGRNGTEYSGAARPANAGKYTVTVTFAETDNYEAFSDSADFEIAKAAAVISSWPSAKTIILGATLADCELVGGSGEGTFAWEDASYIPEIMNEGSRVIFTPTDPANYERGFRTIPVKVVPDTYHFGSGTAVADEGDLSKVTLTSTVGTFNDSKCLVIRNDILNHTLTLSGIKGEELTGLTVSFRNKWAWVDENMKGLAINHGYYIYFNAPVGSDGVLWSGLSFGIVNSNVFKTEGQPYTAEAGKTYTLRMGVVSSGVYAKVYAEIAEEGTDNVQRFTYEDGPANANNWGLGRITQPVPAGPIAVWKSGENASVTFTYTVRDNEFSNAVLGYSDSNGTGTAVRDENKIDTVTLTSENGTFADSKGIVLDHYFADQTLCLSGVKGDEIPGLSILLRAREDWLSSNLAASHYYGVHFDAPIGNDGALVPGISFSVVNTNNYKTQPVAYAVDPDAYYTIYAGAVTRSEQTDIYVRMVDSEDRQVANFSLFGQTGQYVENFLEQTGTSGAKRTDGRFAVYKSGTEPVTFAYSVANSVF